MRSSVEVSGEDFELPAVGMDVFPPPINVEVVDSVCEEDGQIKTTRSPSVSVSVSTELLEKPPEILVAYLSGEPEAVAAIELLREAQRVWNARENKAAKQTKGDHLVPCNTATPDSSSSGERRYSHDDLRVSYSTLPTGLRNDRLAPEAQRLYRRRASANVESLGGATKYYRKSSAPRARRNLQEDLGTKRNRKELQVLRGREEADLVSHTMATRGSISSSSSRRNSSELTASRATDPPGLLANRRPSRLHHDTDHLTANMSSLQSRRSSRASAIFLVSPSAKGDFEMVPEPEEGSPEERRRRRVISIVATVGAFLLVISILLVTVTLRLASHIDDLVRKENENMLQSTNSISGVEANSSISTTMTSISTIINALEEIHVNSSTAATTTTTT